MIQSLGSHNIFNNCKNEARDKLAMENADSHLKLDKLRKKNSNMNFGGCDFSTKNCSKDGLDYTFLSHRSQITNDKLKNTSKDYIYDLSNTWDLNLELLANLCRAYTLKNPDFTKTEERIKKLKNIFKHKNEARQALVNLRGKILIERQIVEEYRRKMEENSELYKEQLKETEENVDNKEEYIKIFEKKLKEVEIYVQKHTKNLNNTRFDIYKSFKMNDFINKNTDLLRRKESFAVEKASIKAQIKEIKEENKNIISADPLQDKKATEFSFNKTNALNKNSGLRLNSQSSETEQRKNQARHKYQDSKVGILMNQYNNRIMVIESKNRLLRASVSSLKTKCFNNDLLKKYIEKIKREQKERERLEKANEALQHSVILPIDNNNNNNATIIEKSNINMDLTRKLATFMDFSTVLNKKDETNYNDLLLNKTATDIFGNPEKQIWDVSCINKN